MFYLKSTFVLIIFISFIILLPKTVKVLNWGYWTHFNQQADSFLAGRLDIAKQMDTVEYSGKYYWHQQPFPSVILLPFKLLWKNFDQFNMQIVLVIVLSILLYKLTNLKKRSFFDSFLLITVFLFGSPVIGLILNPSSWYYAQLITVTLTTGLLLEMLTKKRPLILGILLALIVATRPTAALIIIPISYQLIKQSLKGKVSKRLLTFFSPIALTIVLLLLFNYLRFNNILYNAYQTNNIGGSMPHFRSLGLLSIEHLPTNFYYYFLISVNPVTDSSGAHLVFPYITYSTWGVSLFLVAPFFLYSLKTISSKNTATKLLWLVIILNLIFSMLFFAPGWVQFGPRYTADFFPILYLLVLRGLQSTKLTINQQLLIIVSSLFNIYLYTSAFLIPT